MNPKASFIEKQLKMFSLYIASLERKWARKGFWSKHILFIDIWLTCNIILLLGVQHNVYIYIVKWSP